MFSFEFKDGEREFEMCASKFTGQEMVKCNGDVVSDKTSAKLASPHQFNIDQDQYQVTFYTNQAMGTVGCRMKKNGHMLFQEQLSPMPLIKRGIIVITVCAVLVGFVLGVLI